MPYMKKPDWTAPRSLWAEGVRMKLAPKGQSIRLVYLDTDLMRYCKWDGARWQIMPQWWKP